MPKPPERLTMIPPERGQVQFAPDYVLWLEDRLAEAEREQRLAEEGAGEALRLLIEAERQAEKLKERLWDAERFIAYMDMSYRYQKATE